MRKKKRGNGCHQFFYCPCGKHTILLTDRGKGRRIIDVISLLKRMNCDYAPKLKSKS